MINSRLVPASEFGAHLTPYPPCRGYSFDERSDVERHRIPSVNTSHFFSHNVFAQLSLWWRFAEAEPLYISGPTGAGKSSTACQFCARLGMPVVSVMARPRMDRRELIGRWVMDEKGMRWVDGPAALAWRHGWLLLVNEYCIRNCPIRSFHYRSLSELALNFLSYDDSRFAQAQANNGCGNLHTLLSDEKRRVLALNEPEINALYDMGFRHFKLQGRGHANAAPLLADLLRLILRSDGPAESSMHAVGVRFWESLSPASER